MSAAPGQAADRERNVISTAAFRSSKPGPRATAEGSGAPVRDFRMQPFTHDLVSVTGCHPRKAAVAELCSSRRGRRMSVSKVDRSFDQKIATGLWVGTTSSPRSAAAGHPNDTCRRCHDATANDHGRRAPRRMSAKSGFRSRPAVRPQEWSTAIFGGCRHSAS